MFRQRYPRVWRLHFGGHAGCVLIKWEERGEFLLVRPDGSVSRRTRPPLSAAILTRRGGGDAA